MAESAPAEAPPTRVGGPGRLRRTLVPVAVGFVMGMVTTALVAASVYAVIRHDDTSERPTVYHDFTRSAAGVVERADTGQRWINTDNGTRGARLEIVDNKLTNTAATLAPAAGYTSVELSQPVTTMTATYEFSSGSTSGGAVGLLIRTDVPAPLPSGEFRFTSPAHLAVSRNRMDFGVANNGQVAIISSEQFAQPLAVGKLYTTRVELDYVDSLARVEGPDGKTYVYSDPRIRINRGNVASFEVFQQISKTDDRAAFSAVSVS